MKVMQGVFLKYLNNLFEVFQNYIIVQQDASAQALLMRCIFGSNVAGIFKILVFS